MSSRRRNPAGRAEERGDAAGGIRRGEKRPPRSLRSRAEKKAALGRLQRSPEPGRSNKTQRAFAQMQSEGQGIWKLSVIFPNDMPDLLSAALSGDPEPTQLAQLVREILQHLPQSDPPGLCLLCEHEFADHLPAALAVLTAHIDTPSCAVINGLCSDCATPERLLERVTDKYRESVINGLRNVPMPSSPGHA